MLQLVITRVDIGVRKDFGTLNSISLLERLHLKTQHYHQNSNIGERNHQ
jgi:hypothetical protein